MSASKTVLVQFQNELKPIHLSENKVSEVLRESRTVFSIDDNTTALKLKFTDEDNDLITITLDEELNDALSSAKSEQDLLLFTLELVSSSPSVLVSQPEATTTTTTTTTTSTTQHDSVMTETAQPSETQNQEQQQNETTTTTTTVSETSENMEIEEKDKETEEEKETKEKQGEEELVSNEDNQIRQVSNIEYIANELQYHRLIAQTAVQAVFANLRKNYKERAQPVIHHNLDILNQKKDIVFEAVSTTIKEWRQSVQPLPSAQEIANTVSNALREAGHLAAPVIESIRTSIFKVLDLLLRKNPLSITEAEIEMVSNNVVEEAYQSSSSSSSHKEDQEMENIMSKLDTDSVVAGNEEKDIQIPSTLNNEDAFLVVENYRVHDDPTAQKRERSATDASETLWEAPKEEQEEQEKQQQEQQANETVLVEKEGDDFENLELTKEVIQIAEMGFSVDEQRVKALLKKHSGDIQAVVNELLSN